VVVRAIVPFLIGGVTVLFRRTEAFRLGVVASGCAAVVFLATIAVYSPHSDFRRNAAEPTRSTAELVP
jgi:hypothetical protein